MNIDNLQKFKRSRAGNIHWLNKDVVPFVTLMWDDFFNIDLDSYIKNNFVISATESSIDNVCYVRVRASETELTAIQIWNLQYCDD